MADALGTLKTAYDLTKDLVNLTETTARQAKVAELQRQILDAQESALTSNQERSTLVETIGNLEKEVANLKAWDADKRRYQLTQLRAGAVAYALKPGMESDEPAHQLCASCYQSGFKSFLKQETWNPGRCDVLVCHDCGWYAYIGGIADPLHSKLRPTPHRIKR
jgi:hypothetical protein